MNKTRLVLLTAIFLIATIFIFSCGLTGEVGGESSSNDSGSSSSTGTTGSTDDGNSGTSSASNGTFTDSRDSQVYKWIKIGEQTWMAENLNYASASGSECYKYNSDNCDKYGRLYNWATATATAMAPSYKHDVACLNISENPQGVCPDGWHLPSTAEWMELMNYVRADYTKLNEFGFSVLLGGYGSVDNQEQWWHATEYSGFSANATRIFNNRQVHAQTTEHKDDLLSVRCLKNAEGVSSSSSSVNSGIFTDIRNGKEYKWVEIGNQTWFAENLNYAVEGSKCGNLEDISTNACSSDNPTVDNPCRLTDNNTPWCNHYGRLYNWETAMNACPQGWHLPSHDDWYELVHFVDVQKNKYCPIVSGGGVIFRWDGYVAKYLRASGWYEYNDEDNFDTYEFSALPGGFGYENGIKFANAGGLFGRANWWGASVPEYDDLDRAYGYIMGGNSNGPSEELFNKFYLLSVRCVKD
jgi:uncharacterized protein (TIGR02145 family)